MLLANQISGFFKMKYLKKEVNDEVYFWHADKRRAFLQVDTIILGVHSPRLFTPQCLRDI